MRRVLLTGMSGTGKSTITSKLQARGYKAIDLDTDEWSHWVKASGDNLPGTPVEAGRDWVWRDDRVRALLLKEDGAVLVVSGCSPNQGQFYPLLDAVVLLSAPEDTVLDRLATRTGNDYGKGSGEADRVIDLIRSVEPILREGASHEVDTSDNLADVIEQVLRIVHPITGAYLAPPSD